MYCSKCGKELPEGAQFCPNCGNSISPPTAPSSLQVENSPDQDSPATQPPSAPPAPQQTEPPVPNEEIKCPKCGASGCMPQYKQDVSGGGYGCCQGVLGSLILGPLGLLCGTCGKSVKTTNNLVWICPKCGYEFHVSHAPSKKDMKTRYMMGCWAMSFTYLACALLMLSVPDRKNSEMVGVALTMILTGAMIYSALWYGDICKGRVACTDDEKQQLKRVTIISGVISLICALLPVVF